MAKKPGDDFFDDIETVIYGCHSASRDEVKLVFDKKGIYTYSFAEYFLDEPVSVARGGTDPIVGTAEAEIGKRKIFFPFLPWAASQLLFRVQTKLKGKKVETRFLGKNSSWKRKLREACRPGTELQTGKWDAQRKRIADYCRDGATWAYVEPVSVSRIKKYRQEAQKLSTSSGSRWLGPDAIEDEAVVSFNVQLAPWLQSNVTANRPLVVFRFPISTDTCYYGHLLVVYQDVQAVTVAGGSSPWSVSDLANELGSALATLSRDRYAPTLSLLHFSKWERRLKKNIDGYLSKTTSKDHVSPLSLYWGKSRDEVERVLGQLWESRCDELDAALSVTPPHPDNVKEVKEAIKNSIILDKYHIASPKMIEQVRAVVRSAPLMKAVKGEARSLPSGLVFGEAGSGKDQMARLIATLSKDFWNVSPKTHNMAAVKPTLLAVPLMFGVTLPGGGDLPGLFRKSGDVNKQVLILDELNSLDHDMQGSLLRLLENNEAAPLFDPEAPGPVNALVIGVVNEDPERVTREEEFRLLNDASKFLGRAETARLYEALHKARRLRPDLVYRLKRGVSVRLPALRDRREDIPLLFFHFCRGTIEDLARSAGKTPPKPKVLCELEAYDELMRPELEWPGNIRELQSVARSIATLAWERAMNKAEILVDKLHVSKVLGESLGVVCP